MPPGRKELRKVAIKAETTNGTPVAPRFLWRGPGEGIDDQREVTNVEETVGIFGGTDRSYIAKLAAEMSLAETEATFEQLPDLFMMAGFGTSGGGNRAGSAQGASGSTCVFRLPIPASTVPVTYSYTVESGDDAWAEVMEYTLAKEVKLSFAGGEAVKVSASLFGRQGTATNAVGSFSLAGTIPPVETILASRGSVFLSPVGSGFGTQQATAGNILAGNLTFTSRWEPKFPIDAGILYFHTAVFTGVDIEGEITFEHQASGSYGPVGSVGQKEKWRGEVPQLMTLTWRGGAITEGTTYTSRELTIGLPIKWSDFDSIADQNGNDIVTGKFFSKYNESTAAGGRGTITIARGYGTSEFSGA